MSTFETRWKKMVVSIPELRDESLKMTMTVGEFRVQMLKMYTRGADDEAAETRSTMGSFDLFSGLFGGKR